MIKKPSKQTGYISVELSFGFFVVTLLAIGGFMLGKDLSQSSRIDQAVIDHTIIIKNIESLKRSGVHLPNISAGEKDSSIFLPTMMKTGSSPISYEHKMKGSVSTLGNKADNTFTLTYNDVPANACINFASRIANMDSNSGKNMPNILVAGKSITKLDDGNNFESVISEQCSSADTIPIAAQYGQSVSP